VLVNTPSGPAMRPHVHSTVATGVAGERDHVVWAADAGSADGPAQVTATRALDLSEDKP
jgi:hypothetical protein